MSRVVEVRRVLMARDGGDERRAEECQLGEQSLKHVKQSGEECLASARREREWVQDLKAAGPWRRKKERGGSRTVAIK
jgi:hypothetical protein